MTGRNGGDARLVAELAGGATVAEAARSAGVSESTVYRRLRDADFRRLVDEARAAMVAQAIGRLTAAATAAADTLRALLGSEADFCRLAAARSILELGAKLREHGELEARIAALEERLAPPEGREPPRWPRMA
jgi:AcrR family transcriptional regulator